MKETFIWSVPSARAVGWWRTNFDVETAVGCEEIEHPFCNAFMDCRDTFAIFRGEIDLVVESDDRTLRVNMHERANTEQIPEHAQSTVSSRSCSPQKRKTPYPNTKQPRLPTRSTRVREKPWPAFSILVWVIRRKEHGPEESPGWSSERNHDRWEYENAMEVV